MRQFLIILRPITSAKLARILYWSRSAATPTARG